MAGQGPGGLRTRHVALLGASLAWAGFWLLGGIGAGVDPQYGTSLAEGLVMAGAIGVAPVAPYWWWLTRRVRGNAADERRRLDEAAAAVRIEALNPDVREDWRRVLEADRLVHGFAEEGWVERSALHELDERIVRLEKLLVADAATDRLGGETSGVLVAQVHELRDLLVALADEAVEHQAVKAADHPNPATLAEARDRLRYTSEAYRELPSPMAWPTSPPSSTPHPPPSPSPAPAQPPESEPGTPPPGTTSTR